MARARGKREMDLVFFPPAAAAVFTVKYEKCIIPYKTRPFVVYIIVIVSDLEEKVTFDRFDPHYVVGSSFVLTKPSRTRIAIPLSLFRKGYPALVGSPTRALRVCRGF